LPCFCFLSSIAAFAAPDTLKSAPTTSTTPYEKIEDDVQKEPTVTSQSSKQVFEAFKTAADLSVATAVTSVARVKGTIEQQMQQRRRSKSTSTSEGGDAAWHTAQVAGGAAGHDDDSACEDPSVGKQVPGKAQPGPNGDTVFSELERMVGGGP